MSRICQNILLDKLKHLMLIVDYRDFLPKVCSKFIIFFTIFVFINVGTARPAKAKDVLDTILDTLTGLTCETQGIGNLLRSEFTHTCIPASFFTVLVANIVSPGLYANTFLRVTINDKELSPPQKMSRLQGVQKYVFWG